MQRKNIFYFVVANLILILNVQICTTRVQKRQKQNIQRRNECFSLTKFGNMLKLQKQV